MNSKKGATLFSKLCFFTLEICISITEWRYSNRILFCEILNWSMLRVAEIFPDFKGCVP